jgi:hypothetical protein
MLGLIGDRMLVTSDFSSRARWQPPLGAWCSGGFLLRRLSGMVLLGLPTDLFYGGGFKREQDIWAVGSAHSRIRNMWGVEERLVSMFSRILMHRTGACVVRLLPIYFPIFLFHEST